MQKKWKYIGAGLIVLAASLMVWGGVRRSVTVSVDGVNTSASVVALTVEQALAAMQIAITDRDQVAPGLTTWLIQAPLIRVERAWPVRVLDGGRILDIQSTRRVPGAILGEMNVIFQQGDRLLENGQVIAAGQPLLAGGHVLQIVRAVDFMVLEDAKAAHLKSTAATLGQALWENGYRFAPEDRIALGLEVPLSAGLQVQVRRARTYAVQAGEKTALVRSAAERTGEVLADGGLALQGADYAIPDSAADSPEDGKIRVVRVQEAVVLTQEETPFETEWQPDAKIELDQRSILNPGQTGLIVHRVRVRYEDGKEISRTAEGDWQARQAEKEIIGYGTKVVIRSIQTVDGPVEYWRAVTMYATSYSPCTQGYDHCSWSTASGKILQKGVIGVKVAWYQLMAGFRLFIPGYGVGTIADSGGAVPGKYHVDLGYGKDDFINWHDWVTVYFLTPVPEYIPWILP